MSLRKHREYQKQAIKAILSLSGGSKGQVILTTGSGKTRIALGTMLKICETKKLSLFSVFAPRISLLDQWVTDAAEMLLRDTKLKAAFIIVHSGGLSNKKRKMIEQWQYAIVGAGVPKALVAINPEEIREQVESLRKKGYHVVIFSTYHSSWAVKETHLEFDFSAYDEAHNLVSQSPEGSKFCESHYVPSVRKGFFTATRQTTDSVDGWGMNNAGLFGDVIFEKSPRELIEIGAILPPQMQIVGSNVELGEANYNEQAQMIFESLLAHKKRLKSDSGFKDMIGAKVLVVCDGTKALEGILESRRMREILEENPELRLFGLCTGYGIRIDQTRYGKNQITSKTRGDFHDNVDDLRSEEDALIFHVEMIGEGIDVPGITGVMFLRNCGKRAALQNGGRGARLHPEDAKKVFDTGELIPGNYIGKYIKPYFHVILPLCIRNGDDLVDRNWDIFDSFRSEYDFDPSTNIVVDILQAQQEGPEFDVDLARQIRSKTISQVVEFYQMLEEKGRTREDMKLAAKLAALSEDERLELLKSLP